MNTIRRYAYAALGVALTHLVFGAIVRISGSGMGCGDHWPKCYDRWFPPMNRLDLIIEWSHRALAMVLLVALVSLAVAAWRRRQLPGVSGRGGVLRLACAAAVLWVVPALLGAWTVKLGNPPHATVAHWTVAMALVGVLMTAAIRAGALGGDAARTQVVSAKAVRGALIAATLAFLAVAMGGLTAKFPHAAVACPAFPHCGENATATAASPGAPHVQLTHRVIAFALAFQLVGLFVAFRKRGEGRTVRIAASVATTLVVAQLAIAAAMVLLALPPVLRSLHQAVGVSLWLASFALWYLAKIGRREADEPAPDEGRIAVSTPTTAVAAVAIEAGEEIEAWRGAVEAVDVDAVGGAVAGEAPVAAPVKRPHTVAVIIARGADL